MTDAKQDDAALFDTAPPAVRRGGLGALKAGLAAAASALLLPLMRRLAPDSIGGETLDQAWAVVERLQAKGMAHTLGYWDAPGDTPTKVADIYLAAIERIGASGHDGYLSIKPPALRFDAGAARGLARAALRANVRLHCDSHGLNVAELSFGFMAALLEDLPPGLVSVTLPGRWQRSLADAEHMVARGVGVRIVKGEWPDPDDPARSLGDGFGELVERMAGLGGRTAVASHDPGLVEPAIARLQAAGAPCELEFIFGGQSGRLLEIARRAGVTARGYVPFGRGFVPSALKALRRDPSIALAMIGLKVPARSSR